MCGRFANNLTWSQIHKLYRLTLPKAAPNLRARYNIAPTQSVPVVRATGQGRELVELRWGLIPFWAKPDFKSYSTINARSETLAQRPTFREPFKKRRCLVPVSGFYEWKKDGKAKQPYYITLAGQQPMTFAGLWDMWDGPDGLIESFTIITTVANDFMAQVHNRMPVILDDSEWQTWLEADTPAKELDNLLNPYGGDMEAWPVSTKVNSPKNQGAELIESI